MSVFLSYRRDTGGYLAGRLYDYLTRDGYATFYDIESMRSGKFALQIYDKIASASDFVLVLSEGALDRCMNEGDWVRLEIEKAKELNKNIVLVFTAQFEPPAEGSLPESIRDILDYQGIESSSELFEASVKRLERLLLTKPTQASSADAPFIIQLDLCHMAMADVYYQLKNVPTPENYRGKYLVNHFSSTATVEPGYFPYLYTYITNTSNQPIVITNTSRTLEAYGSFSFENRIVKMIGLGFTDRLEKPPLIQPGDTFEMNLCGRNLLMLLEAMQTNRLEQLYLSVNNTPYYYSAENFEDFYRYFLTSIKKDIRELKQEDYEYREKHL